MMGEMLTGVVVDFDVQVGLGVVRSSSDSQLLNFHCMEIADGTRRIEVGSPVVFRRIGAPCGSWEAGTVTSFEG